MESEMTTFPQPSLLSGWNQITVDTIRNCFDHGGFCETLDEKLPNVIETLEEKEVERLRKLLAEVETDEDPDFDNEDNGPEDVLEENFSDHKSVCELNTESDEDGDSRNEDVNNLRNTI
ncbi:hypothetical protein AVEN_190863-1 [Araneus ventricosus]|uniref:Uncharacterized protein n=1 Tax=Araneus ventricosus TaxID=182803 RepID=A0A4Y2CQF2_ARAVE|nr:hypothetical protein AVEN_190863-1 [Araneus ventricosus]